MADLRTLEDIYPVFGLHVTCGDLELHGIRDEDIPALVGCAESGIHDPDAMPFAFPWSTEEDLPRAMRSYYWHTRSDFGPKKFALDLAVRWRGAVVGCQGFFTEHYAVTRTGETGSWLTRSVQGQGIGTRMRQVMCALLFDHLDAAEITSAAFFDNPASLAVSRKVGYLPNGTQRRQRREGEMALSQQLVLTPDRLVRSTEPLEVRGVEGVRRLIGLD